MVPGTPMRFLLLPAALLPLLQDGADPAVRRLIEKLRSDRVEEREEASRELHAAGEKAVPALREAAGAEDAELRARARAVLDRLDRDRQEREGNARAGRLSDLWPGGTYDVLLGGRRAIRWSFRNEKVKRGDREFLLLRIRHLERDRSDPDGGFSVDLITTELDEMAEEHLCEIDRRLTPSEAATVLQAPSPKGDFAGGRRKVRVNGEVLEAPAGGALGGRPSHVAALMPQEKGAELAFHAVSRLGPRLQEVRLRCEGIEEIEVGKERLRAWRYDDLAPGIDAGGKPRFSWWIGEDRRLLRAREDYYELVLSGAP